MSPAEVTLTHISRILSFNTDDVSLKQDIVNQTFNWENIVKIGSTQLVIPTLYIRLQSKGLLSYLPQELQEYLKYIYDLNKQRNDSLFTEVKLISSWFKSENLEHVFLKGAAMIASNYYEDIGERMLGDIDVLLPREQCEKAFQLLLSKGYTYAKEPTINPKYFEDKHLLRLASKAHIGAIEIHFKLLDTDQKALQTADVLKDKQLVEFTEIPIPSAKHLLIHNVLNFQINDSGSFYNYIGLKNCFDSIVLLPHLKEEDKNQLFRNKHIANNFNLGHLYFNDILKPIKSLRLTYNTKIYRLKNRSKTFNLWHYKSLAYLDFSKLLLHRSWFFIINKNYRKDILNDRERIKAFIKSKL
ncbi:nucleotidyltransferase family protein [Formosa sp. PL04]|uniref:nucleotidyltransferase family protein n=1 Tax=Formosa sp. PL04 TaxID=3081755 RepID=UPI0029822F67|nr:nucleotidyltransferase family protein [Formosa sp. PL04]MDW5287901.1 nucleotidyltransferase family protein [Formosa sp. PL04]